VTALDRSGAFSVRLRHSSPKPGASTCNRTTGDGTLRNCARPCADVVWTESGRDEFSVKISTWAALTEADCGSTTLTVRSTARAEADRRTTAKNRQKCITPPLLAKGVSV